MIRTDRGLFVDKGNQRFDVRHTDFGNRGARGDGIADDTQAILDAIAAAVAAGGGEVYVPPGLTCLVTSALRLSSGVTLRLGPKATLKAGADVNVVEVVAESQFDGGIIDISGVVAYSKAAIYVDGSTNPSAGTHLAYAKNFHVEGNYLGSGIFCESATTGASLTWFQASNFTIRKTLYGIRLRAATPDSGLVWVNGNTFTGFGLAGCWHFFSLEMDDTTLEGVNGNVFSGFQCQPTPAQSVDAISCYGGQNIFQGTFWDLQNFSATQPFIFTEISTQNLASLPSVTSAKITDKGSSNRLITNANVPMFARQLIPPGDSNRLSMSGDQDDALAWAAKRFTVTQDAGPAPTSDFATFVGRIFDPSTKNLTLTWNTTATDVQITIDLGASNSSWGHTGVTFASSKPASKVLIEADITGSGSWSTVYSTTTNTGLRVIADHQAAGVTTVWKIRITLNHATQFVVGRIWGYRSASGGAAWLPRGSATAGTTSAMYGPLLLLGLALTPQAVSISADTDNLAINESANVLEVTTDASRNLTGIVKGYNGRSLLIVNVAANNLVIKHDTTSSTGNRIKCKGGADVTLAQYQSARLYYSAILARWIMESTNT